MCCRSRESASVRFGGFTLVELMVVLVIIAMLASLTLGGLAGVRNRAKIDKTKSTIRKLHETLMPLYESYASRRVPGPISVVGTPPSNLQPVNAFTVALTDSGIYFGPRAGKNGEWPFQVSNAPGGWSRDLNPPVLLAKSRLQMLRALTIFEMPDSWGDVFPLEFKTPPVPLPFPSSYLRTPKVSAYAAYKQRLPGRTDAYGSSECLFMIISRGGLEPDVMEQFRADEFGDIDNDGAPEFWDAWGQPIVFSRWAPGVSAGLVPPLPAAPKPSLIQIADPQTRHDPLDPRRVDVSGYALTPLIFSGGADGTKGLNVTPDAGWSPLVFGTVATGTSLLSITRPNAAMSGLVGSLDTIAAARDVIDNITNHDLITK
jgi:prepilin-type N-terminal cleavage/methylation domain-containing protein